MPRLACWSCGRRIYATAAIAALSTDERRCPRCGAFLNLDRREAERRRVIRRQNPAMDPGPSPGTDERRAEDRRKSQRRRNST